MLRGVLLLSRLAGRDVVGPDGRRVGRLADLVVRLDGDHRPPVVGRLLVGRRGAPDLVVPWAAVDRFGDGPVVLAAAGFGPAPPDGTLGPDELLLGRDVLDTQVVDLVGQRLARVADVLLARDGDGRLELAGVEVGFGGVLRRLGLGRGRAVRDVVDWPDLHLTSDRGHAVQLATPRSAVHRLDAPGLAALISRVDVDAATEILAARDPRVAAEAVRAVHPEVAERFGRRARRRFFRAGAWPHRRRLIRLSRR